MSRPLIELAAKWDENGKLCFELTADTPVEVYFVNEVDGFRSKYDIKAQDRFRVTTAAERPQ